MDVASNALASSEAVRAAPMSSGPALELHRLVTAVGHYRSKPISLRLQAGQTLALVGPNGAGKSTLLDTIAGFLDPQDGRIWIAGRDCTQAPPESRRVGYLFQTDALFPHRSVAENLQFGRLASEDLHGLLDRFNLRALAARRPGQLSGGERQRVALARALAGAPNIVLLDEPLSAIDPSARPGLREDLARHLRRCNAPSIIVTHDPTEAMALGQMVGVMHEGELRQCAPAAEVFARPADVLTAQLLGVENIWAGKVASVTPTGRLRVHIGPLGVTCLEATSNASGDSTLISGRPVHVCVRAANVIVGPAAQSPAGLGNRMEARLLEMTPFPSFVQLRCELAQGVLIVAHVLPWQLRGWPLAPGAPLHMDLHAEDVHVTHL